MKVAMSAKAIGTIKRLIAVQGGGEALTSVLGGHTQVGALNISEAAGQLEAGKIAASASCGRRRPNSPTYSLTEQGVEVKRAV